MCVYENPFHVLIRKRKENCIRISNFALLLVVFNWHRGRKMVKQAVLEISVPTPKWGGEGGGVGGAWGVEGERNCVCVVLYSNTFTKKSERLLVRSRART